MGQTTDASEGTETMTMPPGFVPFWISDGPDAAEQAKEFCRSRGLGSNYVKIVREDGAVKVVVKKECKLSVQK